MLSIIEQIVSSLNYSFDNINLVYIDDKMKSDFINSTLKLNKNKENTFLVVCNSSYINYSEFNKLLNEFNKINIFNINNEKLILCLSNQTLSVNEMFLFIISSIKSNESF